MSTLNEFPKIMAQAREDLSANVRGRFSPEDWERILVRARGLWEEACGREADEKRAWESVIVDFYRNDYWGFQPNYQPARDPNVRKSAGKSFLGILFFTFTFTIMAVVWLGQRYTAGDEPHDTYYFIAALLVAVLNYGFFLWRHRNHQD